MFKVFYPKYFVILYLYLVFINTAFQIENKTLLLPNTFKVNVKVT